MPLIILYIWFNFNWSTLSGTGNMFAPENSIGPMCDLEGRLQKLNFVIALANNFSNHA